MLQIKIKNPIDMKKSKKKHFFSIDIKKSEKDPFFFSIDILFLIQIYFSTNHQGEFFFF